MSMTTKAKILQTMIFRHGHIAVLRGPTSEYKEHIALCRADGGLETFSREIFDELVKANLIEQASPENEKKVTIFRVSVRAREAANPLEKFLKAKLISLGYPWPENLEGKRIGWLEAEIKAITPAA
jgi:hypothetical protein